jgi:membrane-associated protease RseP (regulator of RpoE activity)
MRKNAARFGRAALVAGLLLVGGLAGADHARAAAGRTPWLGVYMQELTPELREGMDYRGDGGVLLSGLAAGGPAARAGLHKGDVIVRVDSRTVNSPAELQDVIQAARVGQSVSVEVFRDGERHIISVWLDARPSVPGYGEETPEAPEAPEAPEVREAPAPAAPPAWHGLPTPDGQRRVKRIVIRDHGDLENLDELKDLKGLEALQGLRGLDLSGGAMGTLGMASRGRLGVRIESLSPALGDYFGLKDGKGALVLEVLKDTPAERAGLQVGDVITRAGDQAVATGMDLVSALRGKDGKVALRVVRHGTPRTIEAELEKTEPTRVRSLEDRLGDRPGVQKRIILRTTDRSDLRHELDQLRRQLDELQRRLDEQQGDEGGE